MSVKSPIYAVVDLETTGADLEKDRIIQFGCALIQDGQVVSTFATDINPGKKLSKQIEQLTGIKNSRVKKAPYFEDVAYTIYHLLADCIFVAHNIYFDYAFLNRELKRYGIPQITIKGIDTVELAQIFFPLSPSFRLADLASQLGFDHDRPHQADSDAEVTAQLLLSIEHKIQSLPLTTVEEIAKQADVLGKNTGEYIQMIVTKMKKRVAPLDDRIKIVNGLALKKKEVRLYSEQQHLKTDKYPVTKKQKEKQFQPHFSYRNGQGKMMNLVYHFFCTEDQNKNLAIEAATGMGKTFGYLFPISYFATLENPVIISTASILLQNQLVTKDIPQVNELVARPIQGVVLKSFRHYLDLDRFFTTLESNNTQKQYRIYQMKILVWLTETETGDLDELNLSDQQNIFWNEVRHKGPSYLNENSVFYQDDFYLHVLNKVKNSNVIIVNHAFLCEENNRQQPLLPENGNLIIDEAHQFGQILEKSTTKKLNSNQIHYRFYALKDRAVSEQLGVILKEEQNMLQLFQLAEKLLAEIYERVQEVNEEILDALKKSYPMEELKKEKIISAAWFQQTSIELKKALRELFVGLQDGLKIYAEFEALFFQTEEKWLASERAILIDWLTHFAYLKKMAYFYHIFAEEWSETVIKWCQVGKKEQDLTLFLCDITGSNIEQSSWYQRYPKILYTSASLQIGKDKKFLERELKIAPIPLKVIPDTYDYQQQARLYVPTDGVITGQATSQEYAEYLVEVMETICFTVNQPTLVLFTSHDLLQAVYQRMNKQFSQKNIEVLAQGISGTKEKIMKKFMRATNAVLLGTNSFWEGVDFPNNVLRIILITKLPFDPPTRPFVKAKYRYLEAQGFSSFYDEALPKAGLRLRQAVGRLIRSEKDKGVLLVVDSRLIKAKYGKKLLHALPKELPLIEAPLAEIAINIENFLKK